ncbi:MAG: gliding motility lipoprotein GldD [Bacteroidota bacterium]
MKYSMSLVCMVLLTACGGNVLPKPKAMLHLEFPEHTYDRYSTTCPYDFEKNTIAIPNMEKACGVVLDYPELKAAIYLTYKTVDQDLNTLLTDAQKLSYEHVIKADNIIEQPFINPADKVYGMFYEVTGNAASQSQFYVTDSTRHFLTGSLYFYVKPNYDSIYPAAIYLQEDIRKIMESLKWK